MPDLIKIYKSSDFRIYETWKSDAHKDVPFMYHYIDSNGTCFVLHLMAISILIVNG